MQRVPVVLASDLWMCLMWNSRVETRMQGTAHTHECSEVALPMPVLVHQQRFLMVGKPKPLLKDLLYALLLHQSVLYPSQAWQTSWFGLTDSSTEQYNDSVSTKST